LFIHCWFQLFLRIHMLYLNLIIVCYFHFLLLIYESCRALLPCFFFSLRSFDEQWVHFEVFSMPDPSFEFFLNPVIFTRSDLDPSCEWKETAEFVNVVSCRLWVQKAERCVQLHWYLSRYGVRPAAISDQSRASFYLLGWPIRTHSSQSAFIVVLWASEKICREKSRIAVV
jgi:hypothetical protein